MRTIEGVCVALNNEGSGDIDLRTINGEVIADLTPNARVGAYLKNNRTTRIKFCVSRDGIVLYQDYLNPGQDMRVPHRLRYRAQPFVITVQLYDALGKVKLGELSVTCKEKGSKTPTFVGILPAASIAPDRGASLQRFAGNAGVRP